MQTHFFLNYIKHVFELVISKESSKQNIKKSVKNMQRKLCHTEGIYMLSFPIQIQRTMTVGKAMQIIHVCPMANCIQKHWTDAI